MLNCVTNNEKTLMIILQLYLKLYINRSMEKMLKERQYLQKKREEIINVLRLTKQYNNGISKSSRSN